MIMKVQMEKIFILCPFACTKNEEEKTCISKDGNN